MPTYLLLKAFRQLATQANEAADSVAGLAPDSDECLLALLYQGQQLESNIERLVDYLQGKLTGGLVTGGAATLREAEDEPDFSVLQ